LPLDQVAEGYRAMSERRAIRRCCAREGLMTYVLQAALPFALLLSASADTNRLRMEITRAG